MSTATATNSISANDPCLISTDPLSNYESRYVNHLSSCSPSSESPSSLLINFSEAETSASSTAAKDSSVKVPYPVLSDHRDPKLILPLLQKETQTASKKILDVTQLVENYEKKLMSNHLSEKDRKSFKFECIRRKQQLDALKKHERRVNLQIDYITMKTEIRCLEEKLSLVEGEVNSAEKKQIESLAKKLKQKLDQMKIYMRKRNEEMKKTLNEKQTASPIDGGHKQSTSDHKAQHRMNSSDLNRKRSLSLTNNSNSNKHLKPTTSHHSKPPVVRLASRLSNQQTKSQQIQTPTVRFLNKTTDSSGIAGSSVSPTTPASSSSTLSSPLTATTSADDGTNKPSTSLQRDALDSIEDDGELDVEFDVDELFNDDTPLDESNK
ncbi:unnamed protein product [Adineta ricciae]|uniref:Uncharacterized protein n=1 Tax=Adineta ricciae TaxID=249248 RepID=A0A814JK69_ADIRI|nr:unnamed protein product [Adineta ricciae]